MRRTGINPDQFQHKVAASEGMGGPEIPLDQVQVDGIHDVVFNAAYLRAGAILDQLERSVIRDAPYSADRCP